MNILDDFIQINPNGIYCKYGDFYLDPQQPVKTAVISHAHADHAISGNKDVYCTQATREFMHLRYHRSAAQVFKGCKAHFCIRRAYAGLCNGVDGISGQQLSLYRRL
jgi:Cft2 family RNA processing exonuclease